MRKICIVAFDFGGENLNLQPWRYLIEMMQIIPDNEIIIITNYDKIDTEYVYRFKIKKNIQIHPFKTKALRETIEQINPDIIFWWCSRKTFLFKSLFKKLKIPIKLFYTGPIYKVTEVISVIKFLSLKIIMPYLLEALVPIKLLSQFINSDLVRDITIMTEANQNRLEIAGVRKKKLIKIVQGFSGNSETIKYKINQTNQILFMGRASKIRGIEFLLKSYAQLSKDIPSNLVILARSATDKQVSHLLELAYQYGPKNNVIKILGGWLSRDDLELHISQSSFLVQPFLLIPSETPISILESMSYGKPVIAPNLGGIPELLRHTGLVYKHNDPNDLVRVMREIILNKNLYFRLSENCKQYIEHYPSWGKLTVEIQKSFN